MLVNSNIQNKNIFDSFSEINPEKNIASYISENSVKTDNKIDEVNLTTKESSKKSSKKGKIIFGSTLATTIVTAGIAGIILSRGMHGNSLKALSRISEKLSSEIHSSGLSSTKDSLERTTLFAKKGVKKSIDTMQATSNFTAIKDWLCDKFFKKNRVTAKFADKSRSGFRGIVDRTLSKKYDKVGIKVKDLSSLVKHYTSGNLATLDEAQKMQEVTIKGVTKTLGEWAEILSNQSSLLENFYDDGFSLGARTARGLKRSKLLSGVSEKIRERFFTNNGLFNMSNYKTYVTEDVTSEAKKELQREIIDARRAVTNNMASISGDMKNLINNFIQNLNPADESSGKIAQTLKHSLETFKTSAKSTDTRQKAAEEISETVDKVIVQIKNNLRYSTKEQKKLIGQLEKIKSFAFSDSTYSKGVLEEIMIILKGLNGQSMADTGKKIVSDAELKNFSKLSSTIRNGLEKATEMEMDEYFLKQAELEVGSAATDVISVLFPMAAGSYAIAKSDDKDERISATLTTCIPLVGTFATFVYGTTKMFSGAKNLAFSLVSGFVLNKIGHYCDNLYKKYKDSGSVVEVAKGEYKNLITDIAPKYESWDIEL